MNRVRAGFFSLSEGLPAAQERDYLRWHQLDHMPEQYQLPGMIFGARWASTPACRAARPVAVGDWDAVDHVVLYLMGEPIDQTLDDFVDLGRHLAELGRYPVALPSRYAGALRLLSAEASPRVLVSSEVVPYRPNRGIFLIVEEPTDPGRLDDHLRWRHAELHPQMVATPGVAGLWSFATAPRFRKWQRIDADYGFTVCYLDDEPAAVAERIGAVMGAAWRDAPVRPLLAAPFESLTPWLWD